MKPSRIVMTLGIFLIVVGLFSLVQFAAVGTAIPIAIGGALVYLSMSRSRVGILVFGHTCIVVGAYLITWGLLLLPVSKPTVAHIFARPLFWGIFSLMGGVCAIFHGFCNCVNRQVERFEGDPARR